MSDLSLLSSPADPPWLGLNRLPMWLGDREWAQLAPTLPQRLQQATEPVVPDAAVALDRKSTRLNSSHSQQSRMPSSA